MLFSKCRASTIFNTAFRGALRKQGKLPSTVVRSFASVDSLKKTALFDLHEELGGKMVDFAGYAMPVQYKEGIMQSHLHTRKDGCASIFDVSHMGQLRFEGADSIRFLESIVVGDIGGLNIGQSTLSLITTESGGILDDCVITKYEDHVYVVVNAGNKDKDWDHIMKAMGSFDGDCTVETLEDRSLIAVQGPGAADIVSKFFNVDVSGYGFMSGAYVPFSFNNEDMELILTRCGYTGEDGFEVSIPSSHVEPITKALLESDPDRVWPAGLGARDSLRLEAGLCLHGQDITTETTPIEAVLTWTIPKHRREEGGFTGDNVILDQWRNRKTKLIRKRVGFQVSKGSPPVRAGALLVKEGTDISANPNLTLDSEEVVGIVTSGVFSPCLQGGIGMAYVDKAFGKAGTVLQAPVRKKVAEITIAKMPFVETRYFKKD